MADDLISRGALLADLREKGFLPAIVRHAIERAPAVDAVEVVRCKDCIGRSCWWKDDFCSYGERNGFGSGRMTLERAIGLASAWADGHVNALRDGEAEAYHKLCLELLLEKLENERSPKENSK